MKCTLFYGLEGLKVAIIFALPKDLHRAILNTTVPPSLYFDVSRNLIHIDPL